MMCDGLNENVPPIGSQLEALFWGVLGGMALLKKAYH